MVNWLAIYSINKIYKYNHLIMNNKIYNQYNSSSGALWPMRAGRAILTLHDIYEMHIYAKYSNEYNSGPAGAEKEI